MKRGRDTQQLDLVYDGSSLALGPGAGGRAPDAPVRGAAGQPTRLFRLFAGTHWTLLAYESSPDAVSPRPGLHVHRIGAGGDIVDEEGHARDAYAFVPGDWVLVRPDGYIGARVSASQAASLAAYLAAVGLSPLPD